MIEVVSHSQRVIDEKEEKCAVESKEKEGLVQSAEYTEFVRDACGGWVDELFAAGGCRDQVMAYEQLIEALKNDEFDWGLNRKIQ